MGDEAKSTVKVTYLDICGELLVRGKRIKEIQTIATSHDELKGTL